MRFFSKTIFLAIATSLAFPVLGQSLDEGFGAYNEGDYSTALENFKPLAEQGDVNAQFMLGSMYSTGNGVPLNMDKAVEWLRRAAKQDDVEAQFSLGVMYRTGKGVSQNLAQAAKFFRLAAKQGQAKAQTNLAVMYGLGDGVSRNPVMAYMLADIAATQGYKKGNELREFMAKDLSHEQLAEGKLMASEWHKGTPLPKFKDFHTWP